MKTHQSPIEPPFLLAHSHPDHPDDLTRWEPLIGPTGHIHRVTRRALRFACTTFKHLPEMRILGYLVGRWHDLGKFSDAFQQYLCQAAGDSHTSERTGRVDHSSAGAQHAMSAWPQPPFNTMVAYVVAGHHAGLLDGINAQGACLKARLLKDDLPPWRSQVPEALLGAPSITLQNIKGANQTEIAFQLAFATRMLFSCLVDADFLTTEWFMNREQSEQRCSEVLSIADLNEHLICYLETRFPPATNTVAQARADVLNSCIRKSHSTPGLFSLTVPTGGGKTLSSLAFALGHCNANGLKRVIYAIPFTSIIDQTAAVFRDVFDTFPRDIDELLLEHHSNFDPEKETTRTRLASENWDTPLIVTTNVQLFESLFANRPSACRKLHHIANSVIILDEAQTLPVTLLLPCLRALELLMKQYGCTVVLCSATQPAIEQRDEFPIGLPTPTAIIDDAPALYQRLKRVEVQNAGTIDCETLSHRVQDAKQALVIVNTRRHAAALYQTLVSNGSDDECFHLSAAMTPEHRTQVLAHIRQRLAEGQACQVVATQLIEAGVDVDFPVVWRAMAGLDSIAQAAGRCNREGKQHNAVTWIFKPEEEAFSRLFGTIKTGASATAQIIGSEHYNDLLDLDAIEQYFRLHYWNHQQEWDKHTICDGFRLGDPKLPLDCDFATVAERFRFIDNTQRPVTVGWNATSEKFINTLRQLDALGVYPKRKLTRQLQRQTITVSQALWSQALSKGQIEILCDRFSVLTTPELHYDAELGLQLDADPLYDSTVLIQ